MTEKQTEPSGRSGKGTNGRRNVSGQEGPGHWELLGCRTGRVKGRGWPCLTGQYLCRCREKWEEEGHQGSLAL